ncbi:MAG: hypothetical protein CM1200mP18_06670 [Gammaproteobacteria bacterium]|nr:MAG: hypothetical protein CM1200mP18_06670 [Gammaproteobacteria bacterium]
MCDGRLTLGIGVVTSRMNLIVLEESGKVKKNHGRVHGYV